MKPCIWATMIDCFLRDRIFNNGLTLPFLIGIERLYNGNKNFSIDDLFLTIPETKVLQIDYCDGIREYVFSFLDSESKRQLKPEKNFCFVSHNQNDNEAISKIRNHELVSEFFTEKYYKHIDSNFFSKNGGKWGAFSQSEIDNIKKYK